MKKAVKLVGAVAFMLILPLAAAAAEGMEHRTHEEGMDHSGMKMQGEMVMLGEETENGVKAMAHLKDVSEVMSMMGMDTTHHLMVMFADTATGKPIEEGMAAVKITGPDGKTSDPVKLMGMEGHFGADVVLKQKGGYQFEIGTKLKDGQKRQFKFEYTLK